MVLQLPIIPSRGCTNSTMDCASPPALAAAAVLPPPPLPGVAQEQVQIPPSSTANHAVVPSLDDDDNFDVDATTQLGPTGLQPGAFQRYYNDQSQLEANKKSGVILIMMADVLKHEMLEEHKKKIAASKTANKKNQSDTEPLNTTIPTAPKLITNEEMAKTNEVLSVILKSRGFHKKLVLAKNDVFAELKRRVPNIQSSRQTFVNLKNTTVYGLMQKLLEYPITDPGDITFIKSEFLKWETTFQGMVQPKSSDGRLTFEDKLRVIHIIATDDVVRAEYLRSTDGKNRAMLDYQNSDKAPKDWKELLCERFNDEDRVYETKPFPDLHDVFRNRITLNKGSIELTPDKVKTTMTDYKKKVLETIRKYNLSGNGADMAIFPDDEPGEY
jgi:hypothetical protein